MAADSTTTVPFVPTEQMQMQNEQKWRSFTASLRHSADSSTSAALDCNGSDTTTTTSSIGGSSSSKLDSSPLSTNGYMVSQQTGNNNAKPEEDGFEIVSHQRKSRQQRVVFGSKSNAGDHKPALNHYTSHRARSRDHISSSNANNGTTTGFTNKTASRSSMPPPPPPPSTNVSPKSDNVVLSLEKPIDSVQSAKKAVPWTNGDDAIKHIQENVDITEHDASNHSSDSAFAENPSPSHGSSTSLHYVAESESHDLSDSVVALSDEEKWPELSVAIKNDVVSSKSLFSPASSKRSKDIVSPKSSELEEEILSPGSGNVVRRGSKTQWKKVDIDISYKGTEKKGRRSTYSGRSKPNQYSNNNNANNQAQTNGHGSDNQQQQPQQRRPQYHHHYQQQQQNYEFAPNRRNYHNNYHQQHFAPSHHNHQFSQPNHTQPQPLHNQYRPHHNNQEQNQEERQKEDLNVAGFPLDTKSNSDSSTTRTTTTGSTSELDIAPQLSHQLQQQQQANTEFDEKANSSSSESSQAVQEKTTEDDSARDDENPNSYQQQQLSYLQQQNRRPNYNNNRRNPRHSMPALFQNQAFPYYFMSMDNTNDQNFLPFAQPSPLLYNMQQNFFVPGLPMMGFAQNPYIAAATAQQNALLFQQGLIPPPTSSASSTNGLPLDLNALQLQQLQQQQMLQAAMMGMPPVSGFMRPDLDDLGGFSPAGLGYPPTETSIAFAKEVSQLVKRFFPNRNEKVLSELAHHADIVNSFEAHDRQIVLRYQLQFYFSPLNLFKDYYLRSQMDSEGFVPLKSIAAFPRVKLLNVNLELMVETVKSSDYLELKDSETSDPKVRTRFCPQQYLTLPQQPQPQPQYNGAPGAKPGSELPKPPVSSTQQERPIIRRQPAVASGEITMEDVRQRLMQSRLNKTNSHEQQPEESQNSSKLQAPQSSPMPDSDSSSKDVKNEKWSDVRKKKGRRSR